MAMGPCVRRDDSEYLAMCPRLAGTTVDLKLAVEAAGENVDRATVGVIGGVGDQLVIRGQRQYLGVRA